GLVAARARTAPARIGRLDVASNPAPEVELPAGLGPDLRLPVRDGVALRRGGERPPIARAVVLGGADDLLRLREDLADGDPELRAGLQDAHAGLTQGQVLPVGALDEPVQGRIVERLPPAS